MFCVLMAAAYAAWLLVRVERRPGAIGPPALRHALHALAVVLAVLAVGIVATGGTHVAWRGLTISLRSPHNPVLMLAGVLVARTALSVRPRMRMAVPWRAWAGHAAIGIAVAALALAPFLRAVASQLVEGSFPSPPVHWRSSPKGVDALAFLMPNPNHALFGETWAQWLRRERADGYPENVAAVTLVAPMVIVAGLRRRRRVPWFFVFLAGVFGLLALGPFVWVAGVNTAIPTPWALLRYVPVVGLVRSPARFAVVAMLGLAVLFAFALAELLRRHPGRRFTLVAAVAAAVLFEITPVPRPLFPAEAAPVFHTVAGDPRDVRVLELPTGLRDGTWSTGQFGAATQFHQTVHGKAIVGGYLSRLSPRCVRSCRRYPVLDALFTLSEGQTLTPVQRRRAFAYRARFLRRARLGYVVMDKHGVSEHLRRFAVRLLGLVKVDEDARYELYVPDPALAAGEPTLYSGQ